MDISKHINMNVNTDVGKILGKKKSLRQETNKPEEFANDFVQAEMVNLTNDDDNPWNWKKGEKLHQWTRDKYFVIHKVEKYPESSIWLIPIKDDGPGYGYQGPY